MQVVHRQPRSRKARALAAYLVSQALMQATSIVRGLIMPNLLGPTGYGFVALVNTFDRFTPYVNAGSHYYVLNRAPVVDDAQTRQKILDSIFGFTLLVSAAAGLLILVAALLQADSQPVEVVYGIATLTLSPLASGLWQLHSSVLRVDERITLLTRLRNAQSIGSTILLLGLTWLWGVMGTFTAQLLTVLLVLAIVVWGSPYRFQLRLQWGYLRTVLAFSIPVFVASGLLATVADSMEIFALAHFGGPTVVGHYAWALAIVALLYAWTNSLVAVFSTQVVRGVHGDSRQGNADGMRFFARLQLAGAVVFVGLATLAYVFLPVVVRLLFPSFEPGLTAARVLIVAAYYHSLTSMGMFALTSSGHFGTYLALLAVLVVVLFPLLWWLAPLGVMAVALLAVLRRFLSAHFLLQLTIRQAFGQRGGFVRYCVCIYLLGLLPVLAGWLVDLRDLPIDRTNFLTYVPQVGATFVAMLAVVGAALYLVQRRFGLLRVLWQV